MFKSVLKWILLLLYRVEIKGEENLHNIKQQTVVIANHTSFLDAVLLYAFLPINLTFAINTYIAHSRIGRIAAWLVDVFPLDPTNPFSIRSLIHHAQKGHNILIFPEGRITVTGSLMKIYSGSAMVADKSHSVILPIRIDGAQFTPFSRLKSSQKLRWFPKITLHILKPTQIKISDKYRGRQRREQAGRILSDLMTKMIFKTSNSDSTLVNMLLSARRIHGGSHQIIEDIKRQPLNYNQLISRSIILAEQMRRHFPENEKHIGVLLPAMSATTVSFWALQFVNKVPAILNFTAGANGMKLACETAMVKTVISSRQFIQQAKLDDAINELKQIANIIYLEDLAKNISLVDKFTGLIKSRLAFHLYSSKYSFSSSQAAVILFTSGSEGTPKGVVLSHRNLLSNIQQLSSRIDFNAKDIALNALPLFHSFGLTAGMLLPIISGVKVFFYPSPLHYRVVPEVAYDVNATLLFGTNTFLSGYARFANNYDFYSLRYVFAGAEKLQEDVRRLWQDKFGVRIFEGYGATETSPVISANTPISNRLGTVGQIMPGMEYQLVDIEGISEGKRLFVKGPNIMLGYFLHDNPGVLVPPVTELGSGWYDTGDIVSIDNDGFIRICGRAKRFAKIAGEMVSLTSVEVMANKTWPDDLHAAVALADERKGEQIILLTTRKTPDRNELLNQAQEDGISEINIPRKIKSVSAIPLLGSGKIDYQAATELAEA